MERLKELAPLWLVLAFFATAFGALGAMSPEGTLSRKIWYVLVLACALVAFLALILPPLRRLSRYLGREISRFEHWRLVIYIISFACLALAFMVYCFPIIVKPACPGPTILRWMDPTGAVLDGNVLSPEKEVWLDEVYYGNIGPNHFEVYEVYDRLFDA